jgi:hypothetical protein
MLGIGLHSYGFTDAAFFWLSAFIVSQLVIMGLGYLPVRKVGGRGSVELRAEEKQVS